MDITQTPEYKQLQHTYGHRTDPQALEAYAGQLIRLHQAQTIVNKEGPLLETETTTIPHPALEIERKAQEEIRKWALALPKPNPTKGRQHP